MQDFHLSSLEQLPAVCIGSVLKDQTIRLVRKAARAVEAGSIGGEGRSGQLLPVRRVHKVGIPGLVGGAKMNVGVFGDVKNIAHLSQMSGTISGMAGTLSFSTEEIGTEPVTLPFGAQSDGQSTITGQFYTFGHHTDNPDPHRMAFYAVMDNGAKYCFKAGDRLDVTEQVHNAPDFRHVHIIIDGLDLPEPIEGGSGYDPAVDDWVVIEEEIIL